MSYSMDKARKLDHLFYSVKMGMIDAPISFFISLTDYCFSKCQMCGHWKRKDKSEMKYHDVSSILMSTQDRGTQSVSLTGGDIFCWPYLKNLLEDKAILLDFYIDTPLIFNERNFSIELLRRVKWIRISLDSVNKDTYRKIRGIDCLETVKKNISNLTRIHPNCDLGIVTVLQKDNHGELDSIAEFIQENGIKRWIVHPVEFNDDKELDREIKSKIFEKLLERYDKIFPINNFHSHYLDLVGKYKDEVFKCYMPYFTCSIDTQMNVWPCCILSQNSREILSNNELMLGNIREWHEGCFSLGDAFIELWNCQQNLLDKFDNFRDICSLCKNTCGFKYMFYNLSYHNFLKHNSGSIYI